MLLSVAMHSWFSIAVVIGLVGLFFAVVVREGFRARYFGHRLVFACNMIVVFHTFKIGLEAFRQGGQLTNDFLIQQTASASALFILMFAAYCTGFWASDKRRNHAGERLSD